MCMTRQELHCSHRGSWYLHHAVQNGRWRHQYFCMCSAKQNDWRKKWTWQKFTALVEGNFWSTNEKDWNRKALSSLRQGFCYSPTHWNYISTDLANFSLFFILSDHFRLQTMRRVPTGTHLSHTLHHFTNMCLPHDEPCFIKSNFILDSLFLCYAWLCCHTHVVCS